MTIVSVRAQPCKMISLQNQTMHACMHLFYVAYAGQCVHQSLYVHVFTCRLCRTMHRVNYLDFQYNIIFKAFR